MWTFFSKIVKEKYNIELDGKRKEFGNNMILLPFEYLCAKHWDTGEFEKSELTFTIHHFAGPWKESKEAQKERTAAWIRENIVIIGRPLAFIYLKVYKVILAFRKWRHGTNG